MSDDSLEVFHVCRTAAEQGDAVAQYALGLKYYYGEEVLQNDIHATSGGILLLMRGLSGTRTSKTVRMIFDSFSNRK